MRIVTNEEMRRLDAKAIEEIGIPSLVLMENAGIEAARLISSMCQERNYAGELLIICGKGKNGGDGLVAARRLIASGHRVRVFLIHPIEEYAAESATNLKILQAERARVSVIDSPSVLAEYFKSAAPPFFAVDALLGTGLAREIEGIYYDVIEILNQNATDIVSLDISSGVDGDSGRIAGTSIMSTATISFGYPKLGHFLSPGSARRGKLYHVDLTFPPAWSKEGQTFLLTHENTAPLLQKRDRYGHKNSFGHCLLIGGSPGRVGAIVMASNSCLKMGTGLVTVASWKESFPALEVKLSSEIMNFPILRQSEEFVFPKPGLTAFSSLVLGPGLGMSSDAADILKLLLKDYAGPMVIDADGLNLIGEHRLHDMIVRRTPLTVLTPHPGEMARLLNVPKETVVESPVACVREAAERTGAIVVLKGATTLIHSSEGVTWCNHYPNDGMATAGSGDVLAGIIGGLLGQRMNPLDATRLGVYLHSLAGRFAAEKNGHRAMTALSIIENIKHSFRALKDHAPKKTSQACVELF